MVKLWSLKWKSRERRSYWKIVWGQITFDIQLSWVSGNGWTCRQLGPNNEDFRYWLVLMFLLYQNENVSKHKWQYTSNLLHMTAASTAEPGSEEVDERQDKESTTMELHIRQQPFCQEISIRPLVHFLSSLSNPIDSLVDGTSDRLRAHQIIFPNPRTSLPKPYPLPCHLLLKFPSLPAYRPHHSTETTLILTLDSIYNSADLGKSTLLVSFRSQCCVWHYWPFHPSQTLSHKCVRAGYKSNIIIIIIKRLKISFGIDGPVSSYLSNRTQFIQLGQSKSWISPCTTEIPQGSVLGPLIFSLFISPVSSIAAFHKVSQQQYADDTQLFIAISQSNSDTSIASIQTALLSLYSWFSYNGLALNLEKSNTILLDTSKHNSYLSHTSVNIAGAQIILYNHLKLLGVRLDSNLNLNKHVSCICRSFYFHLRALRHIWHQWWHRKIHWTGIGQLQARLC